MISTDFQRVQIQNIVENQLPSFVRDDFPLIAEFLKQYYISQEYPGASVDLIQNIDQYLKLESLTNNSSSTELVSNISFTDTTINVAFDLDNNIFGTYQFPERYGLIQIDDEIILYTSKTNSSFNGCIRGFSGVTSYTNLNSSDKLTFSSSEVNEHKSGAQIINLSSLLFSEFLRKIKYQLTPGFEDRDFDNDVNERLFISRAKDFYQTKGTDEAFRILFGALYGEKVEVINPKDFLFRPSDAQYRITKDLVVEPISGNPLDLLNQTLFQDEYSDYGVPGSYGSITNVEKLLYGGKEYYKLSLDFDYSKDITLRGSIFGDFSVHPKTKVIGNISAGSSIFDVDSTIGFPESGELFITYSSGNTGIATYTSKTINQFFGVSNVSESINSAEDIRLNIYAYGYVGIGTTTRVDMRIGSVLSEPIIQDNTYYYSKNDTATIKSLGITTSGPKVDSWLYNLATSFDIKEIELTDSSDFTYKIITYAENNFGVGDGVTITDSVSKDATVIDVTNPFTLSIRGQGELNGEFYTIQRKILKPEVSSFLSEYSYIQNYFSNIQNTYVKFNQDILVAASSFPKYYDQPLNFYDRKITLNGEYSGDTFTVSDVSDHGYYTGDAVYYSDFETIEEIDGSPVTTTSRLDGLSPGVYFIKRVNSSQFKLSTSQANLYNENYVSVSGIATSNTLEYIDFYNKNLEHQQLLREFKSPNNESGTYVTQPGRTGMLVNGVEILNYKSSNTIYYGEINSIDVFSKGDEYDVINPPVLSISDENGINAEGICAIRGSLKRIDIIDPGFDYVTKPIVDISGGNGSGAKASVNTAYIEHSVSFNSDSDSDHINLTDSTIGFSTYHKFRNIERIIYKTDGQVAISGITTDSQYFVETIDASTVKLYPTESDAISGLNTVSLTSFGTGIHRLQSFNKKLIVSNIVVENSGSNYENKERFVGTSGINTATNQIYIKDHQYNSGEIVQYSFSQLPISGLSSNTSYVITKVDEDNFKISSVGLGTTAKLFYYNTKQYIDFTTSQIGSGLHSFNYEPVSVSIKGEIGVTTFSGQNFNAQIQPVFRGSVESVQTTNSGLGYGSSEILNYNRQPIFNLSSGSGAELLPIANNGRIVEVLVTNSGSGYNSPPDLVVYGTGNYAKLVPIIENGGIRSVKIDSPGIGYDDTTRVEVISSGSNAKFSANIQTWNINLFQKYFNIISNDDGILDESLNGDYGIQYTHLYAPRKLRESIYSKDQDNQVKYGIFDLQKVNGEEVSSNYHSPIIGWAYDGNPIYGPYGFSTKTGGIARAMKSGYEPVSRGNRPPFPQGFFVEDYEFTNSGDLDEHNGRFCITPDYPNGVYAYFATINSSGIENSGPFNKYRSPVFPYFVGNTFKSKPNSFNYKLSSNQTDYDLNSSEYFRNTTPYNLEKNNAYYDFVFQPNKLKQQTININSSSKGSIDNIGILTGGNNYQVNDKIVFDDFIGVQKAKAIVSEVEGKEVTNISVASTSISGLEIFPYDSNGSYIAFATSPHNLKGNDLVSLAGFNTSVNYIQDSFNIGVGTERFVLNTGISTVGATGIVTYFNLSGSLRNDIFTVRENDIFEIGSEKVKVLNVDTQNSRIRVLRSQEGTVSSGHSASSILLENSRKFTFNSNVENDVTFEINKEIYFDPKESLGMGSISGVGIGTTISFSNPGVGLSQIFIPTQSIYIPNHKLRTGDVLVYNTNSGDSIGVSTDGSNSFDLDGSPTVYVGRISNDLIGISTYKIGIGSTGTFVGIASTTSNSGLLYFTGIGTGVYHSFKTAKQNVVTAEASKNVVTVATASTHGLNLGDQIKIDVNPGITTTVTVKYNDYNRRIVFNPLGFTTSSVNVSENSITIYNHGLNSGDKVIHISSSPSGGLVDEKIYYAFRYSSDKIKLCLSKYQAQKFDPEVINITSSSFGEISKINPPIQGYRNTTVRFDLSDSSLSSLNGSTLYSAFALNLYTDKEYKNPFDSTSTSRFFEVSRVGQVGISSNASLSLSLNDKVPQEIYYNFTPINLNFISEIKKEIVIDNEVINHNQIQIKNSLYSGSYAVAGIGTTTTFVYNLPEMPEYGSYNSGIASLTYSTNSISAYGSINSISIQNKGNGYSNIVGISTIISSLGSGAILEPSSTTIGKILSTEIEDIGFDYPVDNTLRPVSNLPEILLVEPLASFREIGITSAGKGYNIAPNLVVIDGYTGKEVKDVDLTYELGDTQVTILKNTFGIYNTSPQIIPTGNSNGVKIKSISYDIGTKNVTVGLNTSFSDQSPFSIGDKVLIENVSVGVGSTGFGYNSLNYNYALFTLTDVNIPLGGSVGVVTYSLDGYLAEGKVPGTFDSLNSSGRIIAQKDFPQFDIKLKKNDFLNGETVTSENNTGIVESWNSDIDLLKVSTTRDFNVGDIVVGKTSNTQGAIKQKIDFNAEIKTDATSIVKKGWNKDTGFLNSSIERLPDNFYYQNFSYSLKSKVPYETWNDSVSSLTHTSGFLKFSDLTIESSDSNFRGVFSDNFGSSIDITVDIISEIDLNCYSDFDLATENSLTVGSEVISDEIYFSTRVLTDYFESFGNRVLIIDDISTQFSSDPRPTNFSIVSQFSINQRVKKIFTYINDKRFIDERQALFISILHNGSQSFIGQYGRVDSVLDLGSFDFNISGDQGQLLFYPTKYQVNNYNISFASFDLNGSIIGVGSTSLGDTANIVSSKVESISSPTNIVSIGTTYRSSKIILEIDADNGILEFDELNVLHDGTNVSILEYGQLTTDSLNEYGTSGLGTYSGSISGGNVNITFNPISGIACTVNTLTVSLASTESAGIGQTLSIGTLDEEKIADLSSKTTYISASGSPGISTIAKYEVSSENEHECAYVIVSVEDTTNNRYEMSEVIILNDSSEVYLTEYGTLTTNVGLGTIGASKDSDFVSLLYTPIAGIDVQIRIFEVAVQLIDATDSSAGELEFSNGSISAGYGFYEGTETDVKRAFTLTHKGREIFLRNFDGSDSNIIDVVEDTVLIPEHFFVSGEELVYSYGDDETPIGIGTTTLGSSVYAIKVDDRKIRLAASSEDALKTAPVALDITSVGVGTFHTFTAKDQNTKCLIALDNYIQSPIVATSVTTGLTTSVPRTTDILEFAGITSFFGGDLIKIDDEIMKINTVGYGGSENRILVDRPWMGTGIATHAQYSLVTKVQGNYNIVDNTLNFITAPQGPTPLSSSTNPPDERDWTGITTFSKFQGRTFLRSSAENSEDSPYRTNYIFDDISQDFDATQKIFTLTSENQNVAGFSTNNATILINGVFQGPTGQLPTLQDYTLTENAGITSITFTGTATSVAYDPNNANIPIGGIIVSVGSTKGFGYQPLVSAGGTAVVSVAGTISSISIGNSGSGYRAGIQTVVNVGVTTSTTGTPSIEFIGTAAVSGGHIVSVAITNPGAGYTSSNPPLVIFDDPLSYSNIPLIYSSSSGFGTEATIDIVVGQGSSVIDFEIRNPGYNYGQNQILTVASGGLSGIPTDASKPFEEFQITIEKTISDKFAGWHFGQLEVLDKIEGQFDGIKRSFVLSVDESPVTIRSAKGSNIDVQATLLVFLNDILQVPGEGYTLTGGSVLTFAEPPKGPTNNGGFSGDKCKILFYKGSGDIDVVFRDVLETVKPGDNLTIKNQEKRLVTQILSSDTVETNPYGGFEIDGNPSNQRTVEWCKQTTDKIIDGQIVSKSRILNEALINPTTNLIQSVGVGSTVVYVESVRTFFDSNKENQTTNNIQTIVLTSQDSIVGASATAIVSIAGTISSLIIDNGGVGYTTAPSVTIANPVGYGTTARATATSIVSVGGTVSSISVISSGTGYTNTNPPEVLIEIPQSTYEINLSNSYEGDFGIVVGVNTTTVGIASTALVFDFYIPTDSYLRDSTITGVTTISGIQTGYYFIIQNSNIGNGVTSLYSDGSTLGIGTQFLDNVYEVSSVSIAQTSVPGIALTYVARVITSVSDYNALSGIGYSSFFGDYSWGKINLGERSNPQTFNAYLENGVVGLTTSGSVSRVHPLKYLNYS